MTVGMGLMSTLNQDTPFWQLAIFAILIGAGLGLSMQTIVIALQNAVKPQELGIATSSNTFFRSIGSTIGVAIFGAIYSSRLAHYMPEEIAKLAKTNPGALEGATQEKFDAIRNNTAVIKTFSPELQDAIYNAFVHAFHIVFISALPVTILGFILALFLRETPLRTNDPQFKKAQEEAAGEAIG